MKPTSQAPDFYKIGNDYAQAPLSAFYNTEAWSEATLKEEFGEENFATVSGKIGDFRYYQDGIFTKLADSLSGLGGNEAPSALQGTFWKNTDGFNKRKALVDADAKYDDELYGAADVFSDGLVPETDAE